MNIRFQPNTLYYGDCLDIMRDFPDESIDLICLDPPFNSDQKYNNIFKNSGLRTEVQIKAFDDTWEWNPKSAERVERVKNAIANPAHKVIAAFESFIPRSKMLSYTSYMAERLYVMHRILKDTGSIYLHCDPYASHYLKLIMDAIFGEDQYLNEVIWSHQGTWIQPTTKYPRRHDTLLFYTKTSEYTFNDTLYEDDAEQQINYKRWRKYLDGNTIYGRNMPTQDSRFTTYLNRFIKEHGREPNDNDPVLVITGSRIGTVQYVKAVDPKKEDEYLGYPTQKPVALYERIIQTSSNPNDIVLDPFAGCGTTIESSLKHNRRVIGIDILPFSLRLINKYRVSPYREELLPVKGVPVDFETARELAKSKEPKSSFIFQDWSISLIDGFASNPQKVGDEGIDGFGMILHKPDNMDKKAIIVQVTGASGSQKNKFDQLHAHIHNENAAMGILITLEPQRARRNWRHTLEPVKMGETTYEPIQCISIEEYYREGQNYDRLLKLPPLANPWTGKEMPKIQMSMF